MSINICMGVDNHHSDSIRVACLDKTRLDSPWPIELRVFTSLDSFAEYWEDVIERYQGWTHVGITGTGFYEKDYFGVLEWLDENDALCEVFSLRAYTFDSQLQEYRVPEMFHTAYELAISTLYRLQAAKLSARLVESTYELERQVTQFTRQAKCLRASLPTSSETVRCPF